MTSTQQKLFWKEIDLIQTRHSLFFPVEQKEYISLQKINTRFELIFLKGYDLPTAITMEIQFALKLTMTI